MVLKYRDVIRMTLFGRHDKNLNDATSIYQGYDRYATTTTGGGVNSFSFNQNTYLFTASPTIFVNNSSSYNNILTQPQPILTNYYYPKSITITNTGNYTTGTPNVYLSDTNLGMTITATEAGGYITGFTITNPGNILFSSAPNVVISGGGGAGATASCQINSNGVLTGLTIINGGTTNTYATNPTYYFSGGGINLIAVITANAIASITNTSTFTMTNGTAINMSFVGGGGTGGGAANISFGRYLTGITSALPYGTFQSTPTISYSGGDINITPQMNGGNTIVTGFNITNGGSGFTSAPTILLSGTGYAYTTCTLTNGVITAITLPVTGGNNLFTGIPTVSVYGGGLPTATMTLNPYNITTGGYSLYQNIKRLRFDLNQEFQAIRIANGAVIFLEFIRMPALTNLSTCYKNLRVIGAQNITVFDSTQGTTGNPILFTCEGGNNAVNYFLSNTEYSRLPVPPNFLNKGYIEFELDTVLTAANNGTVYTPTQLNDLIIKVVIAEPHLDETQDNNLSPDYTKQDYQIQRVYNKQPLRK